MVYIDLIVQLSDCENIEKLFLDKTYQWQFIIKCNNCQNENEKPIFFNQNEKFQGKNDRSEFNFYMKCKNCTHDMSIDVDSKRSPYEIQVNGKSKQKSILAKFECRNTTLIKWIQENDIHVKAFESGTIFNNIDINDVWCDFDEESNQNVMIDKVSHELMMNNQK